MKLHIKNMVCQRCILAVENTLHQLDIPFTQVQLGVIDFAEPFIDSQPASFSKLNQALETLGFEILNSKQNQMIESIKRISLTHISAPNHNTLKLSERISDALHLDYSHLSQVFSAVEGLTIEQYFITQRIEKVKELLVYDEKSLSEIAFDLGFSSVAHLSSQFKKVTGMTPTQFRALKTPEHRRPLDKL
ncbi:MAG: AraC-like DNA-binding protein [Bermanella sp.]|jgi:AraC-like DNA-binding protein